MKLIELIRVYRKLTIRIHKIKITHTLGKSHKTQVMHAHCSHGSVCITKMCNHSWTKADVLQKVLDITYYTTYILIPHCYFES